MMASIIACFCSFVITLVLNYGSFLFLFRCFFRHRPDWALASLLFYLQWLHEAQHMLATEHLLEHFVCINEKQGTHGLKDLGQLYLQAPAWDDELDQIKRDWCTTFHDN